MRTNGASAASYGRAGVTREPAQPTRNWCSPPCQPYASSALGRAGPGPPRARPPTASRRPERPRARTALGNRAVRSSAARAAAVILGSDRSTGPRPWKERTMVTCPRCGNPAILMASEEFQLLDCEFCDDIIDVSDLELSELEPAPA